MIKTTNKEITISPMLYVDYVSRAGKNKGKHPLKIRVTSGIKSRYYSVQLNNKNVFLNLEEWKALENGSSSRFKGKENNRWREIKNAYVQLMAKAVSVKDEVIRKRKSFDFGFFQNEFLYHESKLTFFKLSEECIHNILEKDASRIGTANSYLTALAAFQQFRKGVDLKPEDVNSDMLHSFAKWLQGSTRPFLTKSFQLKVNKKKGIRYMKACGVNTVAIYMRSIRRFYNFCISRNDDLKDSYPFSTSNDDSKYVVRTGDGKKGSALSIDEIKILKRIPLMPGPKWEAKMIWLFLYHTQGMNIRDFYHLKGENFDAKKTAIIYTRRKTRRTEKKTKPIIVGLGEEAKKILKELTDLDILPKNKYVFSLLNEDMDEKRIDQIIRQKTKTINKWLSLLCRDNGLPEITTYWSRHSWATRARGIVSDEVISDALGHSNVLVTQAYLERFDADKLIKVNRAIDALTA